MMQQRKTTFWRVHSSVGATNRAAEKQTWTCLYISAHRFSPSVKRFTFKVPDGGIMATRAVSGQMKRSSRCRVFVDTGARTSGRIGPDVIIVHSRKKKQDEEEEEEEECVCVTLSLVCIEFLKPSNVSSLHFHSFSPSHLFLSSSFISSSSFFTSFSNQFLSCHLSLSCSLHAFLLLLPLFV